MDATKLSFLKDALYNEYNRKVGEVDAHARRIRELLDEARPGSDDYTEGQRLLAEDRQVINSLTALYDWVLDWLKSQPLSE